MNLRKDHSHDLTISTKVLQWVCHGVGTPIQLIGHASQTSEHQKGLQITNSDTTSATMNALVRGSRKSTANCDKHCDVRNSENRQSIERTLHGVGSPPSVQVGVFTFARRSAASTQRIVWHATFPELGAWRSLCPATFTPVAW